MRDPENLHKLYEYIEDPQSIIKVDELPEYAIPDFDLNDETSFKKYMSSIEKDCRNSFEYKAMVSFLKEYMEMNKCSFYANVNNIDSTKIKIHIHHDPLSLYDIAIIIYNKRSAYHESLEEEMVAKEVMYIHYKLQVGLIPLAETVHELVHNQYLFVPTTAVLGKYKEFTETYKQYMLPEQIDMLERIESLSQSYNDDYKTLLSKNYIYVDMSGAYDLPRTEDLIGMVKERIGMIMDKVPSAIKPDNKTN